MTRGRTNTITGPRRALRWVMAGAVCLAGPALADEHTAPATSSAATAAAPAGLSPEQVRMVQRSLTDQGYAVPLTSTWDEGTRSALARFQRSRDLPATGELDPATSRALGVDPMTALPVRGIATEQREGPYERLDARDPDVNCGVNNTVDCRYGGGG